MDSENYRDKLHQITIEGKQFALVPLCTFHDMNSPYFKGDQVLEQFGLRDTYHSVSLYEVVDPKKVMMAKIKYGI